MTSSFYRRGFAGLAAFLGLLLAGAEATQAFKAPHFEVVMPDGEVKQSEESKKDENGKLLLTTKMYMLMSAGRLFMVGTTDYFAPIDPAQELELDCTNFTTAVHGRVVEKQNITRDGRPALRFVSVNDERHLRFSSIVIMATDSIVVQSVASYPDGPEPKDAADFNESLHLAKD